MSDMTRQLTITAAAWASVQAHEYDPTGTLWLVGEGVSDIPLAYLPYHNAPVEFVQACAPCETCGGGHEFPAVAGMRGPMPCPDCRIELVGPCPECGGNGMIANCGRVDNGSDGPCVLAPHDDNFPCYGEGDVASDWSPVSWCSCGVCSCGSRQAWTEQGPCGYCHEQPTTGTVTLGYAYAVGQPLPIAGEDDFSPEWQMSHRPVVIIANPRRPASFRFPKIVAWPDPLTEPTGIILDDRLAHAGPPETLVGKWAMRIELKVVGS